MTEKTRLHLIRHGEVDERYAHRYNGHADVPLSERGIEQYHLMKELLADREITACYSSDLSRCTTGAAIISSSLGLTPIHDRGLRELDIGVWQGKNWADVRAEFPAQLESRMADIVNYRVPEGESLKDMHNRVMPVISGIVERHRGENVLVVAHGGANRVILLDVIGAPLSSLFNIEQDYCCLNIIDYYPDGKSVVKLLNG